MSAVDNLPWCVYVDGRLEHDPKTRQTYSGPRVADGLLNSTTVVVTSADSCSCHKCGNRVRVYVRKPRCPFVWCVTCF